jgi:hypothetical protein
MQRHQVHRREQRLREQAQAIVDQVRVANADGLGMAWTSRETGVDMSYQFEHWRRWAALASEMELFRADVVADLGEKRLAHWTAALDDNALEPEPPPSAFRPVKPLVRHVDVRPRQAFRRRRTLDDA